MIRRKIVIYGAGPGGETLNECIKLTGEYEVGFFLDDDLRKIGKYRCGIPVRCGDDIKKIKRAGIFGVVTEISDSKIRADIKKRAEKNGLDLVNVIHPNAYIAPSVKIGKGNYVKAGVVVDTKTRIGDCCIIDNGVVIAHDNIIGDFCHLAPGVTLGSGIVIGEHGIIGIGVSISTKINIGRNVIIGVGSSVVRDVPDNAVVEGVPGKVIGRRK